MTTLAAKLLAVILLASPADAQELKYFYCYTAEPVNGITYMSDVQPIGPIAERREYGPEFIEWLRTKKLASEGIARCYMAATEREIEADRALLAKAGPSQGVGTLSEVKWKRGAGGTGVAAAGGGKTVRSTGQLGGPKTASSRSNKGPNDPSDEGVPPEIRAALRNSSTVLLSPSATAAFVMFDVRFLYCRGDIYFTYHFADAGKYGITHMRYHGEVIPPSGGPIGFEIADASIANPQDGGCETDQKYRVGPLADWEKHLIYNRSSDGVMGWTKEEAIGHLLALFSVAADPSPWPEGSVPR